MAVRRVPPLSLSHRMGEGRGEGRVLSSCHQVSPGPSSASMSSRLRARELRKDRSWAAKRLWRMLRSRRLAGYKFRREHPIGPYFLDFYCLEAKVGVESDGFQHGFPEQQAHDRARDAYLEAH